MVEPMYAYVCDSKDWTCPDMTEDGLCGKPTITCPYRGEAGDESGGKEGEGR